MKVFGFGVGLEGSLGLEAISLSGNNSFATGAGGGVTEAVTHKPMQG